MPWRILSPLRSSGPANGPLVGFHDSGLRSAYADAYAELTRSQPIDKETFARGASVTNSSRASGTLRKLNAASIANHRKWIEQEFQSLGIHSLKELRKYYSVERSCRPIGHM